jgi:hypothetical protein
VFERVTEKEIVKEKEREREKKRKREKAIVGMCDTEGERERIKK